MNDVQAATRRSTTAVWAWGAGVVSFLVVLPVAAVLSRLVLPSDGTLAHLWATVLPGWIANSVMLAAGVVVMSVVIGTGTAWLVATAEFPGRRIAEWALILPMTVPGYVIAIVYFDLLTFAGPVQTWLRGVMGWGRGDYWFPRVASPGGATVLLAFVLYPYVYLLARSAFVAQAQGMIDAARSLGTGPWRLFLTVGAPLARPAIAAGAAFVAMETLADYGAVAHLGVPTLTTGIYRTWFSAGSPPAAAALAALLLSIVVVVVLVERGARGVRRYSADRGGRAAPLARRPLRGWKAAAAALACALPVAAGFVIPVAELVRLHLAGGDSMWGPRFFAFAANSLLLAAAAAALLVGLGLFLAYARRLDGGRAVRVAVRAAGFGYAVPGAVVAVGLLIALGAADRAIRAFAAGAFGLETGLVFTGTVAALLFAYAVRFTAIALDSIDSGLARIPPRMDDAARSLGHGAGATLLRIHLPMLRTSLLSAAIFVFADVMKELPATLIVRPFNFDTLAVRVFRLAADARIAEASTAALCIIAAGILPVILLSRAMDRRGG